MNMHMHVCLRAAHTWQASARAEGACWALDALGTAALRMAHSTACTERRRAMVCNGTQWHALAHMGTHWHAWACIRLQLAC